MTYVEPLPTSLQAPVRSRPRSSSLSGWTASESLALRWPLHPSVCEGRDSTDLPPPVAFALRPPDPHRPCRDRQHEQRHRSDERERPETPPPQAPRPRRKRRRLEVRPPRPRRVFARFLGHEQQRCRPAVQGRDAHDEMCPGRPARPMSVMHPVRPHRGATAINARAKSRGSAVRAAEPSPLEAPPSPGVDWRRVLMLSGPPFPPGR